MLLTIRVKKRKTTNCFLSGIYLGIVMQTYRMIKLAHCWINCIKDPNFFMLSDIDTFSHEALQLLSTKRQADFPALDSEFRHGTGLEQWDASNHGRSCLENYFCSVLVLTQAPQPAISMKIIPGKPAGGQGIEVVPSLPSCLSCLTIPSHLTARRLSDTSGSPAKINRTALDSPRLPHKEACTQSTAPTPDQLDSTDSWNIYCSCHKRFCDCYTVFIRQ